MNEQSVDLQKLSTLSPTDSSDAGLNTTAKLKMSDNTTTNNNNIQITANDTDDMEDDVTSPFKANHADLITLSSNENEIKTVNRRSRGKSLFKSIFCCFSTSLHRNHGKSSTTCQSNKSKNSSFINSANFNNNSSNSNANNTTITNNNNDNITTTNINNNNEINTDNSQANSNTSNNNTNGNSNNVNNGNNLNNNYININDNSNNALQSNYYNSPYPSYKDNYQHERFLLPPVNPIDNGKKCLIIDLDETLVHSSFKQVNNADFIVPVEIDGMIHQVYVLKRPFVDEFLKKMGQLYECVLFTASLAKYADPVADLLDKWGVFRYRLFREACVYYRGNYVKDLSRLGRDLNKVIILDNSPASYIFHPSNAVPCISWFDDVNDTELIDLIPHFERLSSVDSVYSILKQSNTNSINNNNTNFIQQHQQSTVITSGYTSSQMNNYDDTNQQVPNQSLIYQVQQTNSNNNNNKTDENDLQSSQSSNYNYLLNENKILLSIDLMMATKQQQLEENIQLKEDEK